VRRAPVKFPKGTIIGGEGDFDMHSGYVNVTDKDHLFYWLFEAEKGSPDDAPLIVWSNGGPGCSAMEGATTENGPYVMFNAKSSPFAFTGKLSRNPYAWNHRAHVLYVDQPRYVGYSTGTGDYVTSSRDAGLDMVTFLREWRHLYPEHAGRKIILASESYGGHYVPAWTGAILDYNEHAPEQEKLPLVGVAIGNGIINETLQGDKEFVKFAKTQGLVDRDAAITTEDGARQLISQNLGYNPNFYDYRLAGVECCGCYSYNYSSWSRWFTRPEVTKALNVCGNAGDKAFAGCAGGCVDLPHFDSGDTFEYSAALEKALSRGVSVTFMYGRQDTACNYVGGYTVAESLRWPGADQFAAASLADLDLGGAAVGKMRRGGNLTWLEVEAAGHMVPLNQGAAAYWAIDTLVQRATAHSTLSTVV